MPPLNNPVVSASKLLSFLLRHNPEKYGILLDAQGWTPVGVLLQVTTISRALLDEVVASNNKNRFEFSEDGLRIRARQGHSVEVDLGYKPTVPPEHLYHGTSVQALPSIQRQGLLKMSRHAVHLSADVEAARAVGARHGTPVVLVVCAQSLHRSKQAEFFLTENGVWLTDHVPPEGLLFPCSDCLTGVSFEQMFMVHDGLWSSVADEKEVLHVGCLEKRLGRPLVPADFKPDVPLNLMNGFLPRVRP